MSNSAVLVTVRIAKLLNSWLKLLHANLFGPPLILTRPACGGNLSPMLTAVWPIVGSKLAGPFGKRGSHMMKIIIYSRWHVIDDRLPIQVLPISFLLPIL
jgi:hypothetical protein